MSNKKRKSSTSKISVQSLLELLPESLLEEIGQSMGVDKWVKKLPGRYLFKLIVFSLLNSERLSLRLMEDNFQDPLFRALAPALAANKVAWTGIRDRLIHIDSRYFETLFEEVYRQSSELYGTEKLATYHIKRYDSTMIATFSHLLEGMKVGNTSKGKTQVKMSTAFSDDFLIQMEFYHEQSHLSEERALKQVIQSFAAQAKDSIHVFDNGLKSRKTFAEFDKSQILFVTKLKANARYEVQAPFWQDNGWQDTADLELIQDSVVKLYGNCRDLIDTNFRLIQFRTKKEGHTLNFLTNVWDVSALQIAQIYQSRWDIEVLFRFLKQEMNLTHFVCNQINAIKVMLYCTLITAMLILIYKKQNGIPSYKKAKIRFFKELLYSILLEALDHPDEIIRLKQSLMAFFQRE